MKKQFTGPEISVYLFVTETLMDNSSATNLTDAKSAMQKNTNANVTEKKIAELIFE